MEVHNLYGYTMCQATFEGLRKLHPDKRPFVLTRSGFAGIQKYAWTWTGDNCSYWEHLATSIPMLVNMGLSGIPFVGADIGGFSANADGELLARWTWLGALYPFMRNHSGKGSRRQEPWQFSKQYLSAIREAVKFRYRLLPYLYTLTKQTCETGLPIWRPLFWKTPADKDALSISDQFFFGDLLVAPATQPSQNKRLVYFPQGEWTDFWNGDKQAGNTYGIADTPLASIPMWQKAGSAIPLLEQAPSFTQDANWKDLQWQISLAPTIEGSVYMDKGDGYEQGQWGHVKGHFENNKAMLQIQPASGSIKIMGVPQPTVVNSKYHYQNNQLVVTIEQETIEITW
jgi:alpha-glucosidase